MIHEALSSNITKILSIANLKKIGHLINCPHSVKRNFSKYPCSMYCPRVGAMLFENFDPQHAAGVAFKWQTCAKVDPHPAKTETNFKNFQKEFCLQENSMSF